MSRDRQRLVGAIGFDVDRGRAALGVPLVGVRKRQPRWRAKPRRREPNRCGRIQPGGEHGPGQRPGPTDSSAETSDATGATGDAAIRDAGSAFALTAKAHLLVAETQRYCAASAALLVSCQSNPPLPADLTD